MSELTEYLKYKDKMDKEAAKKQAADNMKDKLAQKTADVGGAQLFGEGSTEAGAMSGAASGALMGSKVMPGWGTVIGGVVGGVAGGLQASAAQKDAARRAKAKAQAAHHQKLGQIEEEKDRKIQGALESMKAAFSKNLQSNKQVKL